MEVLTWKVADDSEVKHGMWNLDILIHFSYISFKYFKLMNCFIIIRTSSWFSYGIWYGFMILGFKSWLHIWAEFSKVSAMGTEKTSQDLRACEVRWYHETTSIRKKKRNKWHQKGLNNTNSKHVVNFHLWCLLNFELHFYCGLLKLDCSINVQSNSKRRSSNPSSSSQKPNLNAGLGISMFTEVKGNNLRRHICQPPVKRAGTACWRRVASGPNG